MMNFTIKNYKELERYLTVGLLTDGVLFLLYLFIAGAGIIWLKVILVILMLLLSAAGVGLLYLKGELQRHRSLWLVTGFTAVALCVLVSLLFNYPSPDPLKAAEDALAPLGAILIH